MKNKATHGTVFRLTALALLAALVVVLQTVATGIRIGPIPITLTLVPIVVGAILFGPAAGALLGAIFGVITLIPGITGVDQFTATLWNLRPFWTAVLCIGKGTLAGLCSGLVCRACGKRESLGCVLASLTAPIANTGTFAVGMLVLFRDVLVNFAGGGSILYLLFITFIGFNFIVEMAINAALATVIARIVQIVKKRIMNNSRKN